ncbi:putative sugar nucleotidyltransferase [Proteiniborus sp. DW1]|uniref:phosphocholine cytidylyltransferase family protein n=1 Tax=Proteiniborus sp. DW1 TaxID=1889883 RepID=UPI00092E0FA6|nr:phosphocholine cytidylyltransferase family protein [Proteiniborus sp. DW1]SCG81929.1 putative sugar nucleotidyltransferase [Proteiniborus sp. DW1]
MKVLILAAGEGSRLRPYTLDKPKCMVLFREKPIIKYTLSVLEKSNITDISIVTGYKNDVLSNYLKENYNHIDIKLIHNPLFSITNMVYTMFCAQSFFDSSSDLIISYSDIIYNEKVLNKLINSSEGISVVIDKDWEKLWRKRMDNPLDDAETMKLDDEGYIKELGKKPNSYADIEGQYIGLIKISKTMIKEIINFYNSLDRDKIYDGKNFDNMYMTTFLQLLIDEGFKVKPVVINGGWIEVDSVDDLKNLQDYEI